MSATTTNKDALYLQSLLKEVNLLTEEIAGMDKKMEKDILAQQGALAVWWEQNIEGDAIASFMADRLKPDPVGDGLKSILKAIVGNAKYAERA